MDKEERKKDREDLLKSLKENAEKLIVGDTPATTDSSFSSVTLPIIRKVMPGLLAQQIIGVQPMTGLSGLVYGMQSGTSIFDTVLTTRIERVDMYGQMVDYFAIKVPYGYFSKHNVESDEIREWCVETFGKEFVEERWYMRGTSTYLFKAEEDRNWFLLRWSS